VGDPAAAAALIAAGRDAWGRIDSVVANAGVGFFGGILDVSTDQVQTMAQTNFLGTVWLAREAVRVFREQGDGGDVVVLGSVAGLGAGGGNEAVYAATKAAQIQFGTSLDREVRSEGIRVAVVAPAAVNTGFAAATGRFGDKPFEEGGFIQPSDIAYAVVTTLRQPRRIRTALWTVWSLAEANG
jgi:NADP-dependent 3-hydroxy acid dehydrogenase YdfG